MQTIPTVWLLRNLDGKLCIRDDKNAAFVYFHHSLPLQASMENVTLCAHNPQAGSDWLNSLSLGTMSAIGYNDNLP